VSRQPAVSNSTPLIALSKIGCFNLLNEYFSEITIPEAVYREVVVAGKDLHGAKEVSESGLVSVKKVQNHLAVKALEVFLDKGEAEAIILANESHAGLLLMDDAEGRRIAQTMGIRITGTVGILLLAARAKKIDLETALDHLLAAGFRLSDREYQRILKLL
jgi:predicted nucleic acid-binding protein